MAMSNGDITKQEAREWGLTASEFHKQLVRNGTWHLARDNQGVVFALQCLCRDKSTSNKWHYPTTTTTTK